MVYRRVPKYRSRVVAQGSARLARILFVLNQKHKYVNCGKVQKVEMLTYPKTRAIKSENLRYSNVYCED